MYMAFMQESASPITTSIFSILKPVSVARLAGLSLTWETTKTVKPENGHSQKDQKLICKTNYRLMQVKSISECSNGSILQYVRPSLSYDLSLRSLFCLYFSGRFTQVLLYRFSCNEVHIIISLPGPDS